MRSDREAAPKLRSRAIDAALWVLGGGLLGASIVLSLDPEPEALSRLDLSDALLHLVGYAALTAAWLFAAVWRPGRGPGLFPDSAALILVGLLGLGLALEALQGLVPARDADWRDALANVVGVGTAWWAWRTTRGLDAAGRLGHRRRAGSH